MKKVALYSVLFASLLNIVLLSVAFAATTTIQVNTLPNAYVTIRILPAGESYSSIQSFYNLNTGSEGKVTSTYTTDLEKVDVELYLKLSPDQTEAEMYERYDGIKTSEAVTLNLPKSEQAEPVAASTDADLEETVEEDSAPETEVAELEPTDEVETASPDSDTPITGQVTGAQVTGKGSSYILYGVGAVVLVGILALGFSFARRSGPAKQPLRHETKPLFRSSDDDLKDAEYRFAEAQTQLDKVKKIKETESRLAQDAEELRRLKGE